MTTDTTEPVLESLTEQIPWIIEINRTPPYTPEDVCVKASVGVILMDTHVHTLTNHGLTVKRIIHGREYGVDFYCTTDS
jgi:hypothetical protein